MRELLAHPLNRYVLRRSVLVIAFEAAGFLLVDALSPDSTFASWAKETILMTGGVIGMATQFITHSKSSPQIEEEQPKQ